MLRSIPDVPAAAPVATPTLRSLEGELLILMSEQVQRAWMQLVALTALMALLVSPYVTPLFPVLWFLAVCTGGYLHRRLLFSLREDQHKADQEKLRIVSRSFTLQGLLRGMLPVLFPVLPLSICVITSMYIVGSCAAVLYATSGYRRAYWPFCLVMVIPTTLAWPLAGNLPISFSERLVFLGCAMTFVITMMGHAKGAYSNFENSYRIRRERLELNRQLSDALRNAESASRAKTRFLASASHDLRQPMHALALFSGSLAMRPLDARTAVIAEQIDKAIQVLSTQLDALLDISRLDAGVVEIRPAILDLKTLLVQLAADFRPLAGKKELTLSLRADHNLRVMTDPVLLLRILGNLVGNAIKYTGTGSVEIVLEAHGRQCYVKVRDTGPGIPVAERQRIFEEFYQLGNSERDRSKGLGLGLAIVSRLATLLQIELHLHSAVGVGSSFEISLPIEGALPQPVVGPHAGAAQVMPAGLRLLVVDDEETIRLGMATLLQEMGFQVALAACTAEALAVTGMFVPALVLADFRLHGDDNGMRTIEALRLRWPALPALLISGDTAPDRLQMAHAAGIKLLHKPVNVTMLRQAIAEAIAEPIA